MSKSNNSTGGNTTPITSGRPTTSYLEDSSFKAVAYYYEVNDPVTIDASKFSMLTHVHYSFIYPNKDGSLKTISQPSRFSSVYQLVKQYKIKMAITVGGPDSIFTALASVQAARTNFTKNILQFVLDNKLDGVDLDWEYPKTSNGTDITFALLVSELSDSLHAWHKYLSAAVTPALYPGAVRDAIGATVIRKVDFLNIMIYDGIGWDIQNKNSHSTMSMLTTSLNTWINTKGLPKYKTIAGVPFYGKNTSNSSLTFRALVNGGADPVVDSFSVNGKMYYYNGISTVQQKTTYTKAKANGVMFWELSQDVNGDNSLVKAAYSIWHP